MGIAEVIAIFWTINDPPGLQWLSRDRNNWKIFLASQWHAEGYLHFHFLTSALFYFPFPLFFAFMVSCTLPLHTFPF